MAQWPAKLYFWHELYGGQYVRTRADDRHHKLHVRIFCFIFNTPKINSVLTADRPTVRERAVMAERRSRSRNRDLAWEFRQFSGLSKHLKKIIYDSNVSLAELRTCGHFEDGKGEEM